MTNRIYNLMYKMKFTNCLDKINYNIAEKLLKNI